MFLFTTASRPALKPTQPPIQWIPEVFPWWQTGRGVKLTTQFHVVPRSRMSGSTPPLPQYVFMAWWPVREIEGRLSFWYNIDCIYKSRDSSVGTELGYGLDDRSSRVLFPAGTGNFSLHHRVHTESGAHPASYPVGTRGSFPGGKAAGA
jgi:hypothetical protein